METPDYVDDYVEVRVYPCPCCLLPGWQRWLHNLALFVVFVPLGLVAFSLGAYAVLVVTSLALGAGLMASLYAMLWVLAPIFRLFGASP